jgi:hypothetical protein
MTFQPGDRVQCTATSQKYTIHAEPHGEDVLVRSERAGGLYWLPVERLMAMPKCAACHGAQTVQVEYVVIGGTVTPRPPVPCPLCVPICPDCKGTGIISHGYVADVGDCMTSCGCGA